jgi:hypothetical protein
MLTQTVHEWISVLEDMFEAQTQTLQTVKAWGSFQLGYGTRMEWYFRDRDGLEDYRNRVRGASSVRGSALAACFPYASQST